MAAVGRRVRGSCAASAAISSREIRPSATDCRWIRRLGRPPAIIRSIHAPDPSRSFSALQPHAEIHGQFRERDPSRAPPVADTAPSPQESAASLARTSMCAQPRDGVLYVFMPPARELEHYLELVAAVEAAAQALQQAIVIEGYEPPGDPRIGNFKVTPDPGVIEVNVQPSASRRRWWPARRSSTRRRARPG